MAHTKYVSNPADWQRVVEIGWRLLTKQDMERFEKMCEDGLLGLGDYGLFEDWSDINRSRDGYIRIRDGLVLVGEVQEMNDERFFTTMGRTRLVFMDFFWRTTRWLLIIGGSCSIQQNLSVIASSR
jgi:hypothetical protein